MIESIRGPWRRAPQSQNVRMQPRNLPGHGQPLARRSAADGCHTVPGRSQARQQEYAELAARPGDANRLRHLRRIVLRPHLLNSRRGAVARKRSQIPANTSQRTGKAYRGAWNF